MKYRFLAGVLMLTPAHALAAEDSLQPIVDYMVDERFCGTRMPESGILKPKLEAAMRGSGLTSAEVRRAAQEKAKDVERELVMGGVDREGYCEGRDFTRKEEWDAYQAANPDAGNDSTASADEPRNDDLDTLIPELIPEGTAEPVRVVLGARINTVVCNFRQESDFMFNAALLEASEVLGMQPLQAYQHLTREAYALARPVINTEEKRAYFCMVRRLKAETDLINSLKGSKDSPQ